MQLQPDFVEARNNLGILLVRAGRLDDAVEQFRRALALAPGSAEVRRNFERYGLLDDQVVFLKGWFKDTLPKADIGALSILRLDGDMYQSTMDALNALYPRVSPGGYCIIDDYALPNCQKAVDEFRETQEYLRDRLQAIGWEVHLFHGQMIGSLQCVNVVFLRICLLQT